MNEHEKPPASALVQLESLLEKPRKSVDLTELREKLAAGRGPVFWRTLEEAAESEDLKEYVEQEFPGLSGQIPQGVDRRSLLKVMGASLAMAGAAACTKLPKESILPYVRQPENVIPGLPMFYATAMATAGYARGVLVESHLNRPTKIEGNPDHPASLGSTTIFEQASLLNLYDPDRSETVVQRGSLSTWGQFTGAVSTEAQSVGARKGEGLAILSGITTSPTLLSQMKALLTQWPSAKWYVHEPGVNAAAASAAKKIAGRGAYVAYDLSQADVIVSLESDFLNAGPATLKYARQFAAKRSIDNGQTPVRFYAVESSPSVSGSLADHHFSVKSGAIQAIAYQLAKATGVAAEAPGAAPNWLGAVADDLNKNKGRCVVIPGDYQPESVHLAAYAINAALGNVGTTVQLLEAMVPDTETLEDLTADLNNGHVEMLVILESNPVYSAPASLDFESAIRKARMVVRLGLYYDETSRWSHWHVPAVHYLESWSDARAFDGTATIMQPLVEPLYRGKSVHELLSVLLGKPDATPHDIVKGYWNSVTPDDFDVFWKTSLHNGVAAGTAAAVVKAAGPIALPALAPQEAGEWEVTLRPDPTIGDGAWSNNGWLQELPKPQTKSTWDNLIYMRPSDAEKMGVHKGDLLKVTIKDKSITGPVWITPNQAQGSAAVFFGYGRTASGRVGNRIGYNAYAIQDTAMPFTAAGSVSKAAGHYAIANTQDTQTMEEREPIRTADWAEYKEHPNFPTLEEKPISRAITLYPDEWKYPDHKWGMTVDLNICTGCSACSIACQAENNIAVVGKDQVSRGRQMHWIRIDRYYSGNGSLDEPATYNQPVPCMQCENAPCELVCPVAATTHSKEGINQMVYNRCVGTRYCSNNCPYKVRRFNFYLFSDWNTESLRGMRNPDVTVRSRGVMEKCTYCIQRIQEVKITAEKENNRRIADGEILTACQQVCPTQAITFGDLNDPNSKVAKLAALKRNYNLLDDINTRPRTTYLGHVRNSNEALRGQLGSNREG
jgi:MoCo/4Fe-4S cofactor protein with predicted Tat translocation signal